MHIIYDNFVKKNGKDYKSVTHNNKDRTDIHEKQDPENTEAQLKKLFVTLSLTQ